MSPHVSLSMLLITAFCSVCAAGQSTECSFPCQSNATQNDIINAKEETSHMTTLIIVAAIGCIIVVVAITLIAVACFRRRKYGGHSMHKEIPSGSDLSAGRMSAGLSVLSDEGTYIELNDASYSELVSRGSLHPYSNQAIPPRNPQGEGNNTPDSRIAKHIAERPSVPTERLSKSHVYVNVPREDHPYINCQTQPQRQESSNSQHTYDYPYPS